MGSNYSFFMRANMDSFVGQWIAICKEEIVSHGRDVNVAEILGLDLSGKKSPCFLAHLPSLEGLF